ncbi:hypothetical protein MMC32_000032 [Xylographa parallela]|nr:hypothetical protein [Xylographa parallela]
MAYTSNPLPEDLTGKALPTITASYPSVTTSNPTAYTSATDAGFVRERLVIPLVETKSRDMIISTHSSGGTAGQAAAVRYGKVTRIVSGQNDGVIGLIYLAGNIVDEGENLLGIVGGAWPPFTKYYEQYFAPSSGFCVSDPLVSTLCADIEPAIASTLAAAVPPHGIKAFASPSSLPAWTETALHGRRAYVHTLQDASLPTAAPVSVAEGIAECNGA